MTSIIIDGTIMWCNWYKSGGFMVHDGHRQRLRERFLKEGLDGFAPHEVLELLLFYAIPQRNVNPLAHALLDYFGSLHNVLEATPEQLCQVDGVGEYTAAFLSMMVPLFKRMEISRLGEKPKLNNRIKAQEYCLHLLSSLRHEHFYVIALDAQLQLLGNALVGRGSLVEVPAYPRLVVEAALKFNAHSVLLCHNHPGGTGVPSEADLEATRRIVDVLNGIDVIVLDHIIVAGDKALSLVQQGYMNHETSGGILTLVADGSRNILPPKSK